MPANTQTSPRQTTKHTGAPGARPSRLQQLTLWGAPTGIALSLLLALAVWLVGRGLRATPTWWDEPAAASADTADLARRVEGALGSQASARRDMDPLRTPGDHPPETDPNTLASEPWAFTLSVEQANAWLATRLRLWVESQGHTWPEQLAAVRVHFAGGRIIAGARLEREGQNRYVTATMRPEVRDDGSLWLTAETITVGRVAMPASWVLDQASARSDEIVPEPFRGLPEADAVFRVFAGQVPLSSEPEIRLPRPDKRRVRLLALDMVDDPKAAPGVQRVAVTCRTEWTRSDNEPSE